MYSEGNKHQPPDADHARSESYLRAVLSNVLDGIISINEDRIVETFNCAAERIFGYRADEVIGRNVRMLMPEPYRSEHDAYVQNYLRTGAKKVIGSGREVEGRRKDGSRFPLDLAVSEMQMDGKRRFIGILRDITDRKKAADDLRQLNEELEQRVAERTAMLQKSYQALEASMADLKRTQDQLVQNRKMAALGALVSGVAHEINTPVGVCVTAASFLELKVGDLRRRLAAGSPEPASVEKILDAIKEASGSILTNLNRASDLIKSFKQVAVDQATEEKRRFNLREYIDMILLSLRPKYKRTGHALEVNCPEELEIVSYPGVLSQILTNLVMNTLIHGFDGVEKGKIVLDATIDQDQCLLRYSDNGIGMSDENLKRIYDPFFTTKRAHGGSGLGMHIVYNLVTRRLGGRIDCRSAPGEGTVFEMVFPAVQG
jgi:PAS domain S-box-containing protein